MERVAIDGAELAYELRGVGEPLVLIHWGLCASWAEPLMAEPALAKSFTLVRNQLAGFGESDGVEGAASIALHARHCRLLLRELGLDRAHLAGHSSSALIALQVALDFPDAVRSFVRMEPARRVPPTADQEAFIREFVAPAVARYRAGDEEGAVDTFAHGVFGPGYREALERGLPGAFEQAVADADAFFAQELPALQEWPFTEADARRVTCSVLAVRGEKSVPTFRPRLELLVSWLPQAESFELPGGSHLLHLENAPAVAEGMSSFLTSKVAVGAG